MIFKLAKILACLVLAVIAIVSFFPLIPPFKDVYKTRVVLTGSMSPTILPGSIIISKYTEDKDLKIGDAITYKKPDQKDFYITHRIIKMEKQGSLYIFQTKGDAVPAPDQWKIHQGLIEGKVVLVLPFLGYFFAFAKTPPGFFLLILLPALWIIIGEIKNIAKTLRANQKLKKQDMTNIIVLILALTVYFNGISLSFSYFSSTAAAMTGVMLSTSNDPPASQIDSLPDYEKTANFDMSFSASDNWNNLVEIKFYYSFNSGPFTEFYSLSPNIKQASGTVVFNSPAGDGFYRFLSIAKDSAGNIENDGVDLDFLPADSWTVVDTAAPVSTLSTDSTMAVANERVYNGGFESGDLDGWTIDSNGSDHQATLADSKTGGWSALIGFSSATPSGTPKYDSIKQTVTLPSWATSTLSFWYRLLTDSTVSGGYFDGLVQHDGLEDKVVHDGWDDPVVTDTDLGWKNVNYQLNGLEGKSVDVVLKVTQPQDGYRTWTYLDDIKVTAATNSSTTGTSLSLSSHDASGSGTDTVQYKIDSGSSQTYTSPFSLDAGLHQISYHSTDLAGNVEADKQITVNATESASVDFGIVLNEFLPSGKWVELYNNSTNSIDISGWKIKNSVGSELAVISGLISSHGKLKIENVAMNESGDSLILFKPDNMQVDSFTYTFSTPGKSFKRDPDGTGSWKDPIATVTVAAEPMTIIIREPTPIASVSADVSPTPIPTPIIEPTLVPLSPNQVSSPSAMPAPVLVIEPTPEMTITTSAETSTPAPTETNSPLPPLSPSPSPALLSNPVGISTLSIVNLETQATPSPNSVPISPESSPETKPTGDSLLPKD